VTVEQVEDSGARRGRPPESDAQRARRRLAISHHAVRLFREQGVAATSGEQIARAAGVSERTLWRLFRAKEACVEPMLTISLADFVAVLRSWPAHLELDEHLRAAYGVELGASLDDAGQADFAVRHIRQAIVDDPRLGGRLALWGRRLMGEALTQAQRVAAERDALSALSPDAAARIVELTRSQPPL